MKKYFYIILMLLSFILISACGDNSDVLDESSPKDVIDIQQPLKSKAEFCQIVVGGGGQSEYISVYLDANGQHVQNTTKAWDFIRKTSGPCKFTIYSSQNLNGKHVTLGTGLTKRIRAGLDGIKYKIIGAGDTWPLQSVKIERVKNTSCHLYMGGRGVRMKYYVGWFDKVPAMNRINYMWGGNCDAKIWNKTDWGANDYYNRFKVIHPNASDDNPVSNVPIYNPGYDVRSMHIRHMGYNCDNDDPNYDFGRCLPEVTLPRSLFTNDAEQDLDKDGLDDEMENRLAEAFKPIFLNHSSENATTDNRYYSRLNKWVTEPVTVYQVIPKSNYPDSIELRMMELWRWDKWDSITCLGHPGDSQFRRIHIKTIAGKGYEYGKYWWLYRLSGTIGKSTSQMPEQGTILCTEKDEDFTHESILAQETQELKDLQNNQYIPSDSADNEIHQIQLTEAENDLLCQDIDPNNKALISAIACKEQGSDATRSEEFSWEQGVPTFRGSHFDYLPEGDNLGPNHIVVYFSKGKHHDYADAGWSGQFDKICPLAKAYVNARGHLHNPPYPKRGATLVSPYNGGGDRFGYNNVGSKAHHFMQPLDNYGFAGKNVFGDGCFYYGYDMWHVWGCQANAVDRHFD